LDQPAQADLGVRLAARLGDLADGCVVEQLAARDRAVGGQDHAVPAQRCQHPVLR
jgi:hypothetical protein